MSFSAPAKFSIKNLPSACKEDLSTYYLIIGRIPNNGSKIKGAARRLLPSILLTYLPHQDLHGHFSAPGLL